jgi:hypothetical protein
MGHHFIAKPFTLTALTMKVREVLEKGKMQEVDAKG